jgi:hypothetical protein
MSQVLSYERPIHVEQRSLPAGPVAATGFVCLMPAIAPVALTIVFHWPVWWAIVPAFLGICVAVVGATAVRSFRCVAGVYPDRFQVTLRIAGRFFWTRQVFWTELASCQVRPASAGKSRVLSVSPRLMRVMDFDNAVELITVTSTRLQVGSDRPAELAAAINAARSGNLADTIAIVALAAPARALGGAVASTDVEWIHDPTGPSRTQSLLLAGVIPPPPESMAHSLSFNDADEETCVDAANSEAERRLFAALSADPRTADLFALNVALDFQFGNRPAEADLYARSLGLVIEIDGWHHFQNPANYRRDRRKDWTYRRHDYRVHRELAEDVMTDLPAVLDRIARAVQDCRTDQQGERP